MNLKLRVVFSIIAIASLALTLTPGVAFAATSGSTPGSFSCGNVAATIPGPIVPGDGTITPDVPNTITIPVTDANTLDDIESITVHIYYDADGSYVEGSYPADPDVNTYAILTWTNDGTADGVWTIEPAGTQWAIDPAGCSAPSLDGTTGDFTFSYIPSPVAQESTSSAAEWHVFVEVNDGSLTPPTAYTENLEMAWYGAVTVADSVNWGTVTPGMTYGEDTASEFAGIDVTYVCNGAYDEKIAASGTWTGASATATLDPTEAVANANEFSLRADDDGTLPDAVVVNTEPANYTAIDTTGTITSEAGDLVTTNSIWLKLSSIFTADTYNGTIYYQIAQGS